MPALTPAVRFALFLEWGSKCAWCWEYLVFSKMQVDHLLPKSLSGEDEKLAKAQHGLPDEFDLEALPNLVPSCARCNGPGFKGHRIPPSSPAMTLLLAKANERAAKVAEQAKALTSGAAVAAALATVEAMADDQVALEAHRPELEEALQRISRRLGEADGAEKLQVLPDFALVREGEDWGFQYTGYGDCPNDNCYTGDIRWQRWRAGRNELLAGPCDVCSTWAAKCPGCGEVLDFFTRVAESECGVELQQVWDPDGADVDAFLAGGSSPERLYKASLHDVDVDVDVEA